MARCGFSAASLFLKTLAKSKPSDRRRRACTPVWSARSAAQGLCCLPVKQRYWAEKRKRRLSCDRRLFIPFYTFHTVEIENHNDAQHDAVPAEHFEIVLFDVAHQELNRQQRDGKRRDHADQQDRPFRACEVQSGLDELEAACAKHHRDGQEERKF